MTLFGRVKNYSNFCRFSSVIKMSTTSSGFPRLLSIQSHIVHGFVGNKAAAFPLQTMGFDIDCINTVTLSNHPGYRNRCKGVGLESSVLSDLVEGLESNSLLRYDVLLSGYTRQIDHLKCVVDTANRIRATKNSKLIYVCDPVLGDNGSYYVPEELREFYLRNVLPAATCITPNVFETQVLCGLAQPIRTISEAVDACRILHSKGPEVVILTGLPLSDDTLSAIVSYLPKDSKGDIEIYQVEFPRLPGSLSGCGDLFAALCVPGIYQTYSRLLCTRGRHHRAIGACLASCAAQASLVMTEVIADTLEKGEVELRILAARNSFIDHRRIVDMIVDSYVNLLSENQNENQSFCLSPFRSEASFPPTNSTAATVDSFRRSISVRCLSQLIRAIDETQMQSLRSQQSEELLPLYPLGIIFDMDGTLTLPGAIDFKTMREHLVNLHAELPFAGDVDLVTYLNSLSHDPQIQERMFKVVQDFELAACEKQELRPHLHAFLILIRHMYHIPLALSTRNCLEAADIFLNGLYNLPSKTFDIVQPRNSVMRDGEWKNKPHPSVAEDILMQWFPKSHDKSEDGRVLDNMKFASKVVFVGDSMDDMRCGRAAGCTTILIRTPENDYYLSREDTRCEIDFVVESLDELAKLLIGHSLTLPLK